MINLIIIIFFFLLFIAVLLAGVFYRHDSDRLAEENYKLRENNEYLKSLLKKRHNALTEKDLNILIKEIENPRKPSDELLKAAHKQNTHEQQL